MSPTSRGDRGSKTRDPKTDPARAPSALVPPGCRTLYACRWHRPPAIPGCPAAESSSQQFNHLSQRLRADLAAQAHPCPTAKHNLDDAVAIRPPRPIAIGGISTGTIAPLSTAAFGNSCRHHRNSWLLFTSWRRATIDTEAPGTCVSATICALQRFGVLPALPPLSVH